MEKERNTRYCAIRAARFPGVWMATTLLLMLVLAFCAPASAAVLYWDGCFSSGAVSEGSTQGDGVWTAWSPYPDGWSASTALSTVRNNAAPHNVPKAAFNTTAGQGGYAEIQANLTAAGYWAIAATQTTASLGTGAKTVSNVTGWVGLPTTTTIFSSGNAWNTMGTYQATSATPKIRFGENGNTTNRWYLDQIRWTSATPTAPTATYPADGATNVPVTGIGNELTWTPGNYNYRFDVYLSTVKADVDSKAEGAKVSPDQAGTSFDPDALGLVGGTTYYWKVVAKNVDATAETPTLSFTATDTLAYVMSCQAATGGAVSTTGGTVSGPTFYLPGSGTVTYSETPKANYFFIGWTTDVAGTTPIEGSTSPSWTFTPTGDTTFYGQFATDTTPPTGSIEINPPTHTANSYIVSLVLSATDTQSGVATMCFANDDFYNPGNPGVFSTPVPYATSASWTLITDPDQGGGPGTKTVYVKYTDNQGNSSVFTGTVTLSGNVLAVSVCGDPPGGAPTGAGAYPTGQSVTLHANPNTGFSFQSWTTDGCGGYDVASTAADYTFNMPGYDYHLYANYAPIAYTLTVNTCANGSVGGDSGAKLYGASCTVTATPSAGCKFVSWTTDACGGTAVVAGAGASYTFNMPSNNYTLYANFAILPVLTVDACANGTATITAPAPGGSSESIDAGTSSTVTATVTDPATYEFKNWTTGSCGGTQVSLANPYTFPMPATDLHLYANFQLWPVLTVAKTPPAGGTVTGSGSFHTGTSVTVTAAPAANFVFQYWTTGLPGGAAVVSRKRNYTFNMPSSSYTITAVFAKAMFTEGFEGLAGAARTTATTPTRAASSLDASDTTGPNQDTNGDTNPATFYNPWWGTGTVPTWNWNGLVVTSDSLASPAISPRSGGKMMSSWVGSGMDYLNLAYRANGGSALTGDFYTDWYFYDPVGSAGDFTPATGVNYIADNISVAYINPMAGLPAGAEWPASITAGAFYPNELSEGTVFAQKLSLGCANDISGTFDKTKYQARVSVEASASGGYHQGWYNLSLTRSVGWHHARILVGAAKPDSTNDVSFYIDDMVTPQLTKATGVIAPAGYNGMEILTMYKPSTMTNYPKFLYYDDISVGKTGTQSIDSWNVMGAYPNADINTRLTTDYIAAGTEGKTEATIWPSTGKTYNGKTWRLFKGGGMIDFNTFFSPAQTNCATYMATYINNTSGSAITDADLTMGSDDGIQVILNGVQVSTNNASRGITMDSDHYGTFTLNTGVNLLMLKAANGTGGYAAQARLTHEDGTPLTGVAYFTSEDGLPTGAILINGAGSGGTTGSLNVTLTLSATDDLSGVARMQFSDDGVTFGAPVAYATTSPYTLPAGDGLKTVYVEFIDNAGNVSAPVSASITVTSCSPPAGTTHLGKISDIWALANDATVYDLTGKTVTAVWSDGFWIEESSRGAGVKVLYSSGTACTVGSAIAAGSSVDVYGTLSTGDQRLMTASVVVNHGAATAIEPVIVTEKYGGGRGVNVTTPAVAGGKGIYGVGLLVKIAGTISLEGADYYLDDGSGLLDGTIHGMKIISLTPPPTGSKVVTGVIGIIAGKPVIYATSIQ